MDGSTGRCRQGPALVRFQVALTALLPLALAVPGAAQSPEWSASIASTRVETTEAVMSDGSGGAIACGTTNGALFGPNIWNENRAWMVRVDPSGAVLWSKQFGLPGAHTWGGEVATDSNGGFFAAGFTDNGIWGPPSGWNIWAGRFDLTGSQVWLKTYFYDGLESSPVMCEVAAGGLILAGTTNSNIGGTWVGENDVFTFRIDAAGDVIGSGHIGSSNGEEPFDIAPDDTGGAWVCGITYGSLGGPHQGLSDGWLARCAANGTFLWTVQLGSSGWDSCDGVMSDGAGGVLVSGATTGDLGGPATGNVPFVARYDGAGNPLWIRRFDDLDSTSGPLGTGGLCSDGKGGAFLSVRSADSIVGPNQGAQDAVWVHLDNSGDVDWMAQFGTPGDEFPTCIAEDGTGGFVSGGATGLASPAHDAFVVRFDGWGVGFETYCTASASSIAGCQASIGGSGPVSLYDPQLFEIRSGDIPGANLGLCIFGANGAANIPFGTQGGALCVQPPFFRSAPGVTGGTSGQCDGELAFGLDDLIASSNIVVPGADLRAQIWARDPASGDGFILSDALHFYVSP